MMSPTFTTVIAATTFLILAILPAVRKALYDVKSSSLLLFGERRTPAES